MTTRTKPGPGPVSRVSRKQLLEAARRFYVNGDTQAEIAADMGLSPSYMARLVKQARDEGMVRIEVEADPEVELATELLARYPQLIHAEVVPSYFTAQETARALGTVAAQWFDDLIDTDEANEPPRISRVAIGGSMVHQYLVERVARRPNRLMVGATALTPPPAKVSRFTAPIVASRLADRLGALSPGSSSPTAEERTGFFYCPMFRAPTKSLTALRAFFEELETDADYMEMMEFWQQVDVAFVSAVPISSVYDDVQKRLKQLGLEGKDPRAAGATVAFANRFLNTQGMEIPLAEGIPSYEAMIPTEIIRATVQRRTAGAGSTGYVVLDAWGKHGSVAKPVIEAGLCNVVMVDDTTARALLC